MTTGGRSTGVTCCLSCQIFSLHWQSCSGSEWCHNVLAPVMAIVIWVGFLLVTMSPWYHCDHSTDLSLARCVMGDVIMSSVSGALMAPWAMVSGGVSVCTGVDTALPPWSHSTNTALYRVPALQHQGSKHTRSEMVQTCKLKIGNEVSETIEHTQPSLCCLYLLRGLESIFSERVVCVR